MNLPGGVEALPPSIGPFRLDRPLGRGGFAPVFLATEVFDGRELRTVAVKLFGGAASGRRTARMVPTSSAETARVVEEARALCRVEHPNIVRFHQLASDPATGTLGLAMEYVQGVSLSQRLAEHGTLEVRDALDLGIALASALAAVHRAGLVHRDVKPANVVESNGAYKLIDFGIALGLATAGPPRAEVRIVDDLPLAIAAGDGHSLLADYTADGALDETGHALSGTVGYMDPVCVREGSPATHESDLYALGATLYEALTRALPARAAATLRGLGGLRGDVIDGRVAAPSVRSLVPDVPDDLAALVDRLLDPSRSGRPRSADLVVAELERLRRAARGSARARPPEDEGPFRGLGRFEAGHRDVFYGRSVELAGALEVLRTRGLCVLVGASGSGKSSLARAAVLPAIEEGALGSWPARWDSVTLSPGADARESLAGALSAHGVGADVAPDQIVLALSRRAEDTGRGVAVLVDQLEELVTTSAPGSRDHLARFVEAAAARPLPGVRVVATVRRDLLDPLLAVEGLGAGLARGALLVAPIAPSAWGAVIDEALAAYGHGFESDDVRAALVTAVARSADAMPLVQFALASMWQARDVQRRVLTKRALDEMGGVEGALERHAEAAFARTCEGDRAREDAVRRALVDLTTARGTRRPRSRVAVVGAAGHPDAAALVDALERERVLFSEGDDALVVAHETLLVAWARLAGWMRDVRAQREIAEEIEGAAALWAEGGREEERLWKSRQLERAAFAERGADLSTGAREFLRRSRSVQRRARVLVSAAVLTVLGGAAAGTALWVSDTAARRRESISALTAVGNTRAGAVAHANAIEELAQAERQKRVAAEARCEEVAAAKAKAEAALGQTTSDLATARRDLATVKAERDACRAKPPR